MSSNYKKSTQNWWWDQYEHHLIWAPDVMYGTTYRKICNLCQGNSFAEYKRTYMVAAQNQYSALGLMGSSSSSSVAKFITASTKIWFY
jgi:hypothetical protein